jgi:large subunit ribosomal protein L35
MPSQKLKTHKGVKKRFTVTATGKVGHKRCGSSHLNSHKSGNKIRKLRKTKYLKVTAEAKRLRRAVQARHESVPAAGVHALNQEPNLVAIEEAIAEADAIAPAPGG